MRTAKVLQIIADFVKVRVLGKNDIRTATAILPPGIDSKNVKDSTAIIADTGNIDENIILGYTFQSDKTNEGETRIFATDNKGVEVFSIYLKNDGTVEFGGDSDNFVRFSNLQTGFNELKDKVNDFIVKYNSHTHPYLNVTVPATTSVNTSQSTPTTATIAGAKIDEIKTA